jgi:polyhydroxyalkanoate synthase
MAVPLLALPLTPSRLPSAAANLSHKLLYHGLADLRPTPRTLIASGPQRALYRYLPAEGAETGQPVLLVPPLAVPDSCFDLRRGCSLAEHLVGAGRRTYLVDYGRIALRTGGWASSTGWTRCCPTRSARPARTPAGPRCTW